MITIISGIRALGECRRPRGTTVNSTFIMFDQFRQPSSILLFEIPREGGMACFGQSSIVSIANPRCTTLNRVQLLPNNTTFRVIHVTDSEGIHT
jgi:hypothetical protein